MFFTDPCSQMIFEPEGLPYPPVTIIRINIADNYEDHYEMTAADLTAVLIYMDMG